MRSANLLQHDARRPDREDQADGRRQRRDDETLDGNHLHQPPSPGANRRPEGQLASSRRGVRDLQLGQVEAGDAEHEGDEQAERQQRSPILLLQPRDARRRRLDVDPLAEKALHEIGTGAAHAGRFLGTERHEHRHQPVAQRQGGRAGLEVDEDADPAVADLSDRPVHHRRQEHVGHCAGLGAGEPRLDDADNREGGTTNPDRAADRRRIPAQAALPVVMRDQRDGMGAGRAIVGLREETPRRRPQTETREQAAGDVLHGCHLELGVGAVGDVQPLGRRHGQQLGARSRRVTHPREQRVLVSANPASLAVGVRRPVRDRVETIGPGDGQRPEEQAVDELKGGEARSRRQPQREDRCEGRQLAP